MPVHVVDPAYPLRGLLYCACGQPFFPWGWTEGTRAYLSPCGCRLRPIDATTVEQRVRAKAAATAVSLADGDASGAVPVRRMFNRIEVGGTVDDLRFLRRQGV